MSSHYPKEELKLLQEIARKPAFSILNTVPAIGFQALYGFLGSLIFFLSTWAYLNSHIPYTLAFILNGYTMIMMFTVLHDAVHGSVSRYRPLNDIAGTIGSFLYFPGMSTTLYRYLHLEHHRFTGDTKRDPDTKFTNGNILKCVFYSLIKDVYWGYWFSTNFSDRSNKEKINFVLGTAIYSFWYGLWLMSPYAMEFVLIYVLPQRVGYVILVHFFGRIPHPAGVIQSETPFKATQIITMPRWAGLLLTNQDMHFIHHMFPSIPWHRYHKVWRLGKPLLEPHTFRRSIIERFSTKKEATIERHQTLQLKVSAVNDVAKGVRSYELRSKVNEALPLFSAGAHIDVYIEPGVVRQYSICNSETESHRYVIGVKRDENGRGGSKRLHQLLSTGSDIEVGMPRNNFPLTKKSNHYLLMAAGIGITPILSMAHSLSRAGKKFTLHLFARAPDYLPFIDHLNELNFNGDILYYYDTENSISARDMTGIIGPAEENKALYVCGPKPFMAHIIDTAKENNWKHNSLHYESFSATSDVYDNNKSFDLILTKSKISLTVGANESIIEAAQRKNIIIPMSCGQGMCGTCVCAVISGKVDHRDSILSDIEHQNHDKIAACVSRAKSGKLILDI